MTRNHHSPWVITRPLIASGERGGNVAVIIEELYGQRTFNDSHRADLDGDSTAGRYGHFVGQAYRLSEQTWGVFNMNLLTRTPEFRQATV
mgnify:CR=1 FL=1